jgi:hypothetical protein
MPSLLFLEIMPINQKLTEQKDLAIAGIMGEIMITYETQAIRAQNARRQVASAPGKRNPQSSSQQGTGRVVSGSQFLLTRRI